MAYICFPKSCFKVRTFTIRWFMVSFIVTTLSAPSLSFAEEDDYLLELQSEAENTSNLDRNKKSKNRNKTQSKNSKKPKQNTTTAEPNLDQFEQLLKFERPSTYRFYTRLELSEKKRVVKEYKSSKKISTASKLIFDLYFKHQQ